MRMMLYCFIILCFCACGKTQNREKAIAPSKEVANLKYVYKDASNALHTDKTCIENLATIAFCDATIEKAINLHKIRYIKVDELLEETISYLCAHCTEVEDYEYFLEVARVNKNIQKCYDTLSRYYQMSSREEFKKEFSTIEGKKKAFSALKDEGCTDFGDSFEEFIEFFKKKEKLDW